MQRRALLIGSSYSAAPLFFALKKRGFHVTVCGSREDDPCHQYSDESAFFDYSQPQLLANFLANKKFDFIVPSCNDFAYLSGAAAAETFRYVGFDTSETSLRLHTKGKFRSICQELSLPSPQRYYSGKVDDRPVDASRLKFPLLVKPTDSFSGRGMTLVLDEREIPSAIALAATESRTQEYVVEQFVPGSLHSHTAFLEGGKFAWEGFVDEFCIAYPYQVDCSNSPSLLRPEIKIRVHDAMLKMARAMKLADGLLHTQFLFDGAQFWILETMRRCPGDLYGQLIERSLGVSYTDLYLSKFLDEKYEFPAAAKSERFIGRHTLSVSSPIIASGFELSFASNNIGFVPLKGSAETLGAAPFDKFGILFVEFKSAEDLRDYVPKFGDFARLNSLREAYG